MDGGPKQAAAEQAYDALRARILTGDLAEGERLTEQGIARDLGLSRTPVREAIRRLTHEGFVERGTGYSTRVARFPENELEQIFEIRLRLETYAVSRAATLATPDQIEELRDLTRRMQDRTPPQTDEDYAIIAAANEAFHHTIAKAARSPRLTATLSQAMDRGTVARTYQAYAEKDLVRSAQHHDEIVDAIAARAPEWASSVMASHILAAAVAAANADDI